MSNRNRPATAQGIETATAWAPASLSNLGPGFDCLGLAIDGWGDTVQASPGEIGSVRVRFHPESAWNGTTAPKRNTAAVAAQAVLRKLEVNGGIDLVIHKGIAPGSGAGSSAASAAAAAWAVNLMKGAPLTRSECVSAVLEGEAVASDARHGDNAVPALLGGLVVVSAADPGEYRRFIPEPAPTIAVVLPDVEILTRDARALLPGVVSLRSSVENAASLGMLIMAIRDGDWRAAGRQMMSDRIVEPLRARLIPEYGAIQAAALEAGAFGCALSGSGPAMFAVAESDRAGDRVLAAMMSVLQSAGREAKAIRTTIDCQGARSADFSTDHA